MFWPKLSQWAKFTVTLFDELKQWGCPFRDDSYLTPTPSSGPARPARDEGSSRMEEEHHFLSSHSDVLEVGSGRVARRGVARLNGMQ